MDGQLDSTDCTDLHTQTGKGDHSSINGLTQTTDEFNEAQKI